MANPRREEHLIETSGSLPRAGNYFFPLPLNLIRNWRMMVGRRQHDVSRNCGGYAALVCGRFGTTSSRDQGRGPPASRRRALAAIRAEWPSGAPRWLSGAPRRSGAPWHRTARLHNPSRIRLALWVVRGQDHRSGADQKSIPDQDRAARPRPPQHCLSRGGGDLGRGARACLACSNNAWILAISACRMRWASEVAGHEPLLYGPELPKRPRRSFGTGTLTYQRSPLRRVPTRRFR